MNIHLQAAARCISKLIALVVVLTPLALIGLWLYYEPFLLVILTVFVGPIIAVAVWRACFDYLGNE